MGPWPNLGPRQGVLDACLDRVKKLRSESGRKVSLVGWSLGGICAREIAKLAPDDGGWKKFDRVSAWRSFFYKDPYRQERRRDWARTAVPEAA
jgi:dienelactone hydrolase